MIVRHFLQWVRTATAGERADATSALARAFLISDLSSDDRLAAEGALVMLLDDPSPLVRHAMAEALATSAEAPPAVIFALAADQPDIAAVVLEHSPLLLDADLVDAVGSGFRSLQCAIARRYELPRAVSAAIAEVGTPEACLTLIENDSAEITAFSLDRMVTRHGHLGAIRESILSRENLPPATRQAVVLRLSQTLADFVVARQWLDEGRARRVAKEACEKATVTLAATAPTNNMRALVTHLRESGQLSSGLVLRALLSGNIRLFEETLAELADLPVARVAGLVHDKRGAAFQALYQKAGLPASGYAAFRAALDALHEGGFLGEPGGATRLKRRMVERVLTRCEQEDVAEIGPLLLLLRRFATEATRDEARLFCDGLVANDDDLAVTDEIAA
jgi:uncharacterized protein (DUF2336 family)